jgi:hypothetical protein
VFVSALFSYLNRLHYSPPHPQRKFIKVSFDLDHSAIFLPISTLLENPQINFHTFFVWNQRLGYVPHATYDFNEALTDAKLVMIINPVKHFTNKEKRVLINYVDKGGKVLLMDNSLNEESTANEISQLFGVKIEVGKPCGPAFFDVKGRKISTTESALAIKGGKPILTTESGCSIFSIVRKGIGLFGVMSDSKLFSNSVMGSTGMFPNEEQLNVYELEFWMLKNMLEIETDFAGHFN